MTFQFLILRFYLQPSVPTKGLSSFPRLLFQLFFGSFQLLMGTQLSGQHLKLIHDIFHIQSRYAPRNYKGVLRGTLWQQKKHNAGLIMIQATSY